LAVPTFYYVIVLPVLNLLNVKSKYRTEDTGRAQSLFTESQEKKDFIIYISDKRKLSVEGTDIKFLAGSISFGYFCFQLVFFSLLPSSNHSPATGATKPTEYKVCARGNIDDDI
jgi:hypothetical protein